MNFSSYSKTYSQTEALSYTFATSGDIPSFDDAFNTDHLRKFYQDNSSSMLCHAKSLDDQFFEEGSPSSPDDRETQASPLVRYIHRFNQGNSFADSQFAINLNQRFFSDESDSMFQSPVESLQDLSRESYPITNTKSFDDAALKQAAAKKVFEMKGTVKMTMSFGNIAVQEEAKTQQNMAQILSEPLIDFESEETKRITKLVRSKKVFKIQKDLKPKVSPKKTASPKQKAKAASPQTQPLNLPAATLAPQRTNSLNSLNQAAPNAQPQGAQPSVMNFLQIMKQQGLTPEQIMNHVQHMARMPANVNLQPASLKQL
jgi:hypothetical protein